MRKMKSETKMLIFEFISIFSIYIAALVVRVKFINNISGMLSGDLSIFENATIKANFSNELISYSHGIIQVYAYILNGTCAFLGNKPIAVVCLQCLMQMVGMIFIFFAMRNLTGRIGAVISIVAFAFLPIVFQQVNVVSYENVLFFMISILLVLYSLFFKKDQFLKFKNPSWLVWVLILGALTGVIVGLDIMGVLVIFLGLLLMIGKGKRSSESLIQNRIIVFFTYLFGTIGGLVAIIYGLALEKGVSFIECGIDTVDLYFSDISFLYLDRPMIISTICIVAVATIFQLIINCFIKAKKSTKVVLEAQSIEKNGNEEMNEIKDEIKDEITDNSMKELVIQDNTIEKPIKFIPNPLPLPKKHVKKELNYLYEISEDKMKYDIDVLNEEDDFDLK